ncbi:endolytic transglycosylase MltG [bacterium]|nr:endolytic transglycosylase MltG [bacterium]
MRQVENFLKYIRKREYAFSVLIILCVVIVSFFYVLFYPTAEVRKKSGVEIKVLPGMAPVQIADTLINKGLISNKKKFVIAVKLLGISKKLQAGDYEFFGRLNNYSIAEKLYKGRVITEKITFPEGMRAAEMAELLKEKFNINPGYFMKLVMSDSLCRLVGINAHSLEGYLYPDTYRFSRTVDAEEVIKRMVRQWKQVFNSALKTRAAKMGMTVHEAMTLASIIEGEAQVDSERKTISALYHNRLKRGMRLQADPTIQYIIPDGPRRLLKDDLQINSPYNTYIHAGLPPGPINNPGKESIIAALYPDSSRYLYMVADGDGSHTFSKTMTEHLRAKNKFDTIRKRVRRLYK